jgi:hypothetical protein
MNTNTKQFFNLQRSWYAQLASNGFEDIEQVMDDGSIGTYTKNAVGINGQRYTAEELGESQDYYISASQFLYDHTFESELEREIWECFCNGDSIRDTIKNVSIKVSYRKCRNVINRLKMLLVEYIVRGEDN